MFGIDFYPTPRGLANKMLESIDDLKNLSSILEPSAGKGDLIDAIFSKVGFDRYYHRNFYIDAIEIDTNLRTLLQKKEGVKLVADDFLTFVPVKSYQLIALNPPFSKGAEHLLHAWDIIKNGQVVCLLNAETIKNPYTEARKLLVDIITRNGSCEFVQDGFVDAEKKTKVEVAIVRLKKVDRGLNFEFFEEKEKERNYSFDDEMIQTNLPAVKNVVGNLVIQYEAIKESFADVWKAINKTKKAFANLSGRDSYSIDKILENVMDKNNANEAYNYFVSEVNTLAWDRVFDMSNFRKYMTEKVKQNFEDIKKQQHIASFTEVNINTFLENMFMSRGLIMEGCIEEVFDVFTKFHKENRVHVEGWKSNDSWKVNKKVILPHYLELDYSQRIRVRYQYENKLADIDRAMCALEGKDYDKLIEKNDDGVIISDKTLFGSLVKAIDLYNNGSNTSKIGESYFFNFRFFKKGTLHIEFKDLGLWERFNITVAKKRNWLPDIKK